MKNMKNLLVITLIGLSTILGLLGCSKSSADSGEERLSIVEITLDEKEHIITAKGKNEENEVYDIILTPESGVSLLWDGKELSYQNLEDQIVYSGQSAQEHVPHIDHAIAKYDENDSLVSLSVVSHHSTEEAHDHGDEHDHGDHEH